MTVVFCVGVHPTCMCKLYIICNVSVSCSVVSDSLRLHGLKPTRLLCPWNSPGKNTGVGCHALLQGIFPTQGWQLGFPRCRQILYHLSHQCAYTYLKVEN